MNSEKSYFPRGKSPLTVSCNSPLLRRFNVHGREIVVCLPVEDHIRTAMAKSDLQGAWGEYR